MAYREFHYEKTYAAPDTSDFLDASTRAVSNLFQNLGRQHEERRKSASQWGFDYGNGKFENDDKLIREFGSNTIKRGQQEYYEKGKVSDQTIKDKDQTLLWSQMSDLQMQKAAAINKRIDDNKDPWYAKEVDKAKIPIAVNGEDGQRNLLTRNEPLNELEKNLNGIDSFKHPEYRAHYITQLGKQNRDLVNGNPNAVSTYREATFMNPKTNKPEVTPDDAVRYLYSDPQGRVYELFNQNVGKQLDSEVDNIISKAKAGDDRVQWAKNKTKDEVKHALIDDPSQNIINSKPYGLRVQDMAMEDLKYGDRVNQKISVTKSDKDPNNGGDGKTNDQFAHAETFHDNKSETPNVSDPVANAFGIGRASGPGGLIATAKGQNPGRPLETEFHSNKSFNFGTGKNYNRAQGKFSATGYQVGVYDKSGNFIPVSGNDINEFKQNLKKLPKDQLPNLMPELQIGIKGYNIDKAKMFDKISKQKEILSRKLYAAKNTEDTDAQNVIEDQLSNLEDLRASFNKQNAYDEDILNSAMSHGIDDVRTDQILLAGDADLKQLKITTGLDLKNKANWSSDMQNANKEYQNILKEGQRPEPVKEQKKVKTKASTDKPKTTGTVDIGLQF